MISSTISSVLRLKKSKRISPASRYTGNASMGRKTVEKTTVRISISIRGSRSVQRTPSAERL
ncbi:MAG: hypothetical protein R2991_06395 [Thermoanaerobaculia bacterium]